MSNIKKVKIMKEYISKYKEIKYQIKESSTLDNKHRQMVKSFIAKKNNINNILDEINLINIKIDNIDKNKDKFTLDFIKQRANLLDIK